MRAIYDVFNLIAMAEANAESLTIYDIGTIKIDAITAIHRGELTALTWSERHRSRNGKCIRFVTSDLLTGQALHDIYENRCSKISFCSTVARIRSFHVNNKPVGYTRTNTPGLVHRLSFIDLLARKYLSIKSFACYKKIICWMRAIKTQLPLSSKQFHDFMLDSNIIN